MFILHGESRAENTGRYERDVSVHGVRLLLRCVSATCGTSILPPVRALPACAAASPLPRDRMVAGSLCGAFASPARSLRSLRCPWANWPVPVRIRSRHAGWLQDRQHQTLQRHNLEQPRRMLIPPAAPSTQAMTDPSRGQTWLRYMSRVSWSGLFALTACGARGESFHRARQ